MAAAPGRPGGRPRGALPGHWRRRGCAFRRSDRLLQAMTADPGCIDCGWQPAAGQLWPTEGPVGVRWMERFLICAEGDWFGKPLRLRPDQKRFVYRWYEFCPACGYWRYDEALRGAATGDGKTTFVAALECLEMCGPPQIAPVSPNIINAAASFEQADLLFAIAGVMLGGRDQAVAEAPLCGYAEVYDTEIRYADGRPGIMKRVAAVAGTNEGGLPSLFVGDELHEWGDVGSTKARVHMVIGKSTRKRRMICRLPDGREVTRGPGRKLGISTAGLDVHHTLLDAMYKHGRRRCCSTGARPPTAWTTRRRTTGGRLSSRRRRPRGCCGTSRAASASGTTRRSSTMSGSATTATPGLTSRPTRG